MATAVLYEPGDGPRPILTVYNGDRDVLAIQPRPAGQMLLVTMLDGVQANTHAVIDGLVQEYVFPETPLLPSE